MLALGEIDLLASRLQMLELIRSHESTLKGSRWRHGPLWVTCFRLYARYFITGEFVHCSVHRWPFFSSTSTKGSAAYWTTVVSRTGFSKGRRDRCGSVCCFGPLAPTHPEPKACSFGVVSGGVCRSNTVVVPAQCSSVLVPHCFAGPSTSSSFFHHQADIQWKRNRRAEWTVWRSPSSGHCGHKDRR